MINGELFYAVHSKAAPYFSRLIKNWLRKKFAHRIGDHSDHSTEGSVQYGT